MLESNLQTDIIKWLKKRKIYYINNHGDSWGGTGKPDLVICLNGQFLAIETKVGKNGLQPAQIHHKRNIQRNRGDFFAPYTLEEFKNYMKVKYNYE